MAKDLKGNREFLDSWKRFGDVPINEDEEIDEDFSPKEGVLFEKGTDRFIIWHWYEREFDVCLGELI